LASTNGLLDNILLSEQHLPLILIAYSKVYLLFSG
jgi:hypothetical protein